MDPRLASLLTEFVEKPGLLRHDLKRKGDLEKYEARIARVDAILSKLAEHVSTQDPDLANALRTAWHEPGSLTSRNADHDQDLNEHDPPRQRHSDEHTSHIHSRVDPKLARLLAEFVEKTGLLRQDMKRRGDLENHEARIARVDAMLSKLAEHISTGDPDLAKALRTAWQQPGRSLAFRNADHQKELKEQAAPRHRDAEED